ncbi:hypothetical protein QQ045_008642 [Rhodiola kirilowii]
MRIEYKKIIKFENGPINNIRRQKEKKIRGMVLVCEKDKVVIIGRLLFASVFLFTAWQEYSQFNADGGPAARSLKPKIDAVSQIISSSINVQLPLIDAKLVVAASIAMKGLGGILYIIGSSSEISLFWLQLIHQAVFTPIVYDFYKHDINKKAFSDLLVPFLQNIALAGALLFYVGMNNSTPRRQLPHKKARKPKAN